MIPWTLGYLWDTMNLLCTFGYLEPLGTIGYLGVLVLLNHTFMQGSGVARMRDVFLGLLIAVCHGFPWA